MTIRVAQPDIKGCDAVDLIIWKAAGPHVLRSAVVLREQLEAPDLVLDRSERGVPPFLRRVEDRVRDADEGRRADPRAEARVTRLVQQESGIFIDRRLSDQNPLLQPLAQAPASVHLRVVRRERLLVPGLEDRDGMAVAVLHEVRAPEAVLHEVGLDAILQGQDGFLQDVTDLSRLPALRAVEELNLAVGLECLLDKAPPPILPQADAGGARVGTRVGTHRQREGMHHRGRRGARRSGKR
mmetsp:Transcript_133218/g.332594  ORF Transcript_133218/g.332594 Transcript_133218/m.332594 type:complete len:240 (-) Transcript_133218:631-1350(-)